MNTLFCDSNEIIDTKKVHEIHILFNKQYILDKQVNANRICDSFVALVFLHSIFQNIDVSLINIKSRLFAGRSQVQNT